MKILITGSRGRLGTEVLNLASSKFSMHEILAPTREQLDLENSTAVKSYIVDTQPSHVIHLAGYVYGIGGHKKKPLDSLRTAQIDTNVFAALTLRPPKWIFYSSSVAVYSPTESLLPHHENDFLRGQPHTSESLYANVKRTAYFYLKELQNSFGTHFSYGILSNLFGARESRNFEINHVIEALITKTRIAKTEGGPIRIWGEPGDSRDFISYLQAARIILDLFDTDTGAINIASGKEIQITHLLSLIQKAFGTNYPVEYTYGPKSISRRYSSVAKLATLLSYVTDYDSEIDLSRYIISCVLDAKDTLRK